VLQRLLIPAVFLLFFPAGLSAGTNDNSKIAVHLQEIPTGKGPSICDRAETPPCNSGESSLVIQGTLGVGYDLYFLVQDGDSVGGVAGASFGISYGSNLFIGTWTLCGDLDFSGGPAGITWPQSGSGNSITWSDCENTPAVGDSSGDVTAVLGALYVYAYSHDVLQITKRNYVPNPDIQVANCAAEPSDVFFPEFAGSAAFGDSIGYSPCVADTFGLVWSMGSSWPDTSEAIKSTNSLTLATKPPTTRVLVNEFRSGKLRNAFPLQMIEVRKKDSVVGYSVTIPTPSSSVWPVEMRSDGTVVKRVTANAPNTKVFPYSEGLLVYTMDRPASLLTTSYLKVLTVSSERLYKARKQPLPTNDQKKEEVRNILVDPTGSWGFISSDRATYRTDLGADVVQLLNKPVTSAHFSSDGRIVAAVSNYRGYPRSLHIFDSLGTQLYSQTMGKCAISNLFLTPDGKFLYFTKKACEQQGDFLLDTRTKSLIPFSGFPPGHRSFAKNGKFFLVTRFSRPPGQLGEAWMSFYSLESLTTPVLLWERHLNDRIIVGSSVSLSGTYAAIHTATATHDYELIVYARNGSEVGSKSHPDTPIHGLRFIAEDYLIEGWSRSFLSPTPHINIYRVRGGR